MSEETTGLPDFAPPVSSFQGPVGELIAQRMLFPPARPGLLAALDQFEILRVLGGGGMGVVLLARDSVSGREVAIKLVRSDLVGNQNVVHRFLKEAGHLKRLRHTNVVPVLEISDRREGPYFVMPYFEKGSLANRITPGRPLDTESILEIGTQVAEGLSFAHRSGIIHRDLKPANILLAAAGRACLADFGLARTLFNDTVVDAGNPNWEGTAPYMSPAVAAGDAEDTRCDIYSFGALLYEMLTGWPPYLGRGTKEILQQIIAGPPRRATGLNPEADSGLVAVAEGCMARELRDRYADMRDVLKDLQRLRENQPPAGPRGANGFAIPRFRRDRLVTAGIFACLVVGALWFWQRRAPGVMVQRPVLVAKPVAAAPPAPGFMVTTLAGQAGTGGYEDGIGSRAQFRLPNGVAADSGGNIYVADTGNHTIRKISPNGTVTTVAGVPESHGSADGRLGEARFWAPFGIAVDRAGNIYVADSGNNTIRKITPEGVAGTLAGLAGHPGGNDGLGAAARFRNPWGVAVDAAGNVLVADLSNDTIRKVTPAGLVTTLAGKAGKAGGTDGEGGEARFNAPAAVAVDRAGNIFVSNSGGDTIRKIDPLGVTTTLAGLPGHPAGADGDANNARFSAPGGLAVDDQGNIYVADTGNDTIRKITPDGKVTTLAGVAGASGTTDGTGTEARFNGPGGVAVDGQGNLYVADANNHIVRKIQTSNVKRQTPGSSH